jgi:hypothetical protein
MYCVAWELSTIMSACSSGPTRDGLTVQDAVEINHRLHLSRSRKLADERVRKLGPGAKRWIDGKEGSRSVEQAPDIPTWYALILLEAFTLLREQFRFYPVKCHSACNIDPLSRGIGVQNWGSNLSAD